MDDEANSPRARLARQLDPARWPGLGLSPANRFIMALICAASLHAILETEASLANAHARLFGVMGVLFGVAFSVEYLLRLWTAGERAEYAGIAGRLRWMVTPWALIDLAATLPLFLGFLTSDLYLLRLLRIIRILRLARLGRFSHALSLLKDAVAARSYELSLAMGLAMFLLLLSAVLLYLAEGAAQPEAFGSIPRALWWAVATLTTVGYGDVYPVTVLGRVLAGMAAISAIGLIAMPTGIMASAFTEAFQARHRKPPDGVA